MEQVSSDAIWGWHLGFPRGPSWLLAVSGSTFICILFCLFSFSSLCLSRNLSIISKLSNVLVQLFVAFLYISFYFFRIGSNVSSFISDSGNLSVVYFFSWSVQLKIYQFCWSFQRTNFWFNWFSVNFFYFLNPALIYIISFLLLDLHLVLI